LELQWSNIIKERAKNEFPVSMVVDSEDNIVILANVDASSSLIKINSQGNLLWRKAFDENKHYKLNALIETKDGQYAMVGYCLKNFGTHELEADRVFVKTNRNGEIRLEKNYGNVYTQGGAKALVEDKVGNFILMGDCTDQSSTIDMTLNKVDNQGNAIWRKNVIRKGDDWGISIIKSNDNNIIISGTTDSFGPGQTNIWLLKLDWDANIIFEKAIGKASHLIESDEAIGLIESENGDILVANTIGGPKLDPPMESDMYVIRTDAGGNLLWDKKFGISKYYYWDSAHSLLELNPGEIVVAGRKQDIETTIIDDMRSDLWIIKINGN